jgi:EmrB/QacA subfamily drug resistance transporter
MNGTKKEINKSVVALIAALSSFLTPFTSSSVNIALPSIDRELSLSAISLSWIATSYLLAAAMFLVPFGRIADIYGRKKIYFAGVIIDAVGSVMCALMSSGNGIIFFRGMQGLGGAMIFGTGIAILTSVYPAQERGKALGINVAAVYAGLSAGPLIGGLLTEYLGWRSIFFLNALLGATIIVLVLWKMTGEWRDAKGERFDSAGAFIYSLSLVALMYGFSVLPNLSGGGLIVAGGIGLYGFIVWEKRAQHPLLDIMLFSKNRVFRFSNLAAFINYGATFANVFLLSLYFQHIRGFSAEHAGMILITQPMMQILFSPLAGSLSDRMEPRLLASAGMAATTAGLVMLSFLQNQTPLWYVIASLAIMGVGFGFFSSPNTNAAMSSVDKKLYGTASGMLGTMRLTGQMFSMGIIMLLFSVYLGKVQITPEYHAVFMKCAQVGFAIFAVLCLAGIFASLARGNTHRQEREP